MNPASQLHHFASVIPPGVTLVAVSKFHPADSISQAYCAGQRDFAESRAQELAAKAPQLPGDIRWHFIGHLQTNKVRAIMPHVSLIQSIDSLRILTAVSNEALRIGRTVDILLQAHVAAEETKTGFTPGELPDAAEQALALPGVRVRGIMGMATNTTSETRIRADFRTLRELFDTLATSVFAADPRFDTLSMGMSSDWELAVASGSNMVRIGSAIFGERQP